MRAAPAVTLSVPPSTHWRAALALLACTAVVSTAVWALRRADAAGALVLAGVLALVAASLRSAARRPVLELRWDGQAWWLSEPGGEPRAGDASVAIDLGYWMLLRFREASPWRRASTWPQRVWLPLQRDALPAADWHALRCALYSPRPAAATSAARDRRKA